MPVKEERGWRLSGFQGCLQVFSFGVVLFELLSREITAAAILRNARRQDPELCELYAHKAHPFAEKALPGSLFNLPALASARRQDANPSAASCALSRHARPPFAISLTCASVLRRSRAAVCLGTPGWWQCMDGEAPGRELSATTHAPMRIFKRVLMEVTWPEQMHAMNRLRVCLLQQCLLQHNNSRYRRATASQSRRTSLRPHACSRRVGVAEA